MLTIESKKVDVSKGAQEVYDFLIDLNNLEKLMPQERIEYWKSTEDTCRFGIKNLSSIGMKIKEFSIPNQIVLESDGKNPFDFTLTIFINGDASVNSYLVFEGNVNMFMKAMVQKPLKDFFDVLASNLPAAMA